MEKTTLIAMCCKLGKIDFDLVGSEVNGEGLAFVDYNALIEQEDGTNEYVKVEMGFNFNVNGTYSFKWAKIDDVECTDELYSKIPRIDVEIEKFIAPRMKVAWDLESARMSVDKLKAKVSSK